MEIYFHCALCPNTCLLYCVCNMSRCVVFSTNTCTYIATIHITFQTERLYVAYMFAMHVTLKRMHLYIGQLHAISRDIARNSAHYSYSRALWFCC